MEKMKSNSKKLNIIRIYLGVFAATLLVVGISTFPLTTELDFLYTIRSYFPDFMQSWIATVDNDIHHTPEEMFYGTDWLAFAHIAIAVAFIGPLLDPVRNIWVIQFGIIISVLVVPTALICGTVRHIPAFHQVIDCSFGILALIPLIISYRKTLQLEREQEDEFISPSTVNTAP